MKNLSASIFSIFFFCLVPSASNSLTGARAGAAEESSNLESLFYDDSGSTNKAYFQLNSEAEILSFEFAEDVAVGSAIIDANAHTVTVEVIYGSDLTSLTPTFTLSEGATSSPASGVTTTFTSPVTYTVTAEDGTTSESWEVTVNEQLPFINSIEPNASVAGASVYIYGSAFDPTPENNIITFDGVNATVLEATEKRLKVTVPGGDFGIQEVTVRVDGRGTSNVKPFTQLNSAATANFSGQQQVISTIADGAFSVYAADLDGDGDTDVLSASSSDRKIAWYENNGLGGFSAQQVISTAAIGVISVFSADLDGDGDLDVLSASQVDDKIAWYENNGSGEFSAQQVISTAANGAYSVYSADLDGDGDMDVLSALFSGDKIAWYENNGSGDFSMEQLISSTIDAGQSVYAADLDGDGDMDVLSASAYDDKIAWYENNGSGGFSAAPVISTAADNARSVFSADLDGDGDMDVLSASFSDDKIAWYENNGSGDFSDEQVISNTANGARSVFSADLDGDGDMDVLSASSSDDKITWYKNNGSGGFSAEPVISTAADGARSVFAADLDGDGDIDVLSASSTDNKIVWYENLNTGNERLITEFSIAGNLGTIDASDFTVSIEANWGITPMLSPDIVVSNGASVSPSSGTDQNFSQSVIYTVSGEDGQTQDWTVTNTGSQQNYFVYYPFTGNANDASSNEINGTSPAPWSTPTLVDDRNGSAENAYSFDGNDIIELSSDILNGSLQGTLAAWVNFSNISGGNSSYRTIIGKGSSTDSQFGLFATNSSFVFEAYNDGIGNFLKVVYNFDNAGLDYSDGGWHHVAVTFSQSKAILYVDGVVKGSDNTTNGVYTHTSTNKVTIGDWGSPQNDPWKGLIDEVRIYNYALSAYEIGEIACLTEDLDNDGDGTSSCADCDDTNPDVQNPTWYADTDGDGFGNPTVSLIQCDQPQGFVADATDCNDDYSEVKPRSGYVDADGDGYGAIDSELIDYCGDGEGYSENDYDQDDSDKDIWLDDGSVCTIDSFSEEMGPIYAPLNCDDNNACTIDSCDPIEGCINTPVDCDDGDPSTIDLCNSISGCYYIPVSIATGVATFSINDVEGVIDTENHEITIQADAGAFDLAAITADFTIRSGATAKIAGEIKESGDQLNPYTTPFIMTVIAEDGITSQDWTVTINIPPSVNSISPNAAVVGTRLLIDGSNFDPTSNTVTIDGINANVHSSSRTSLSVDVPEAAFGKDLDVSVTSRGQTTTIIGAFDVISTATDILTFSISEVAGVIDTENHEITVTADVGSFDLDALIAEFTVSLEATAQVNGEPKASGNQLNPYTTPFIMSVIAEDGLTSQDWTVTIDIPPSVDAISPNAAVVGTRLLIDGSNFDPTNNTVTIDGINANVHSSSRASLRVDVPEAVSGKDLDVSVTSRGQTTTLVGSFDVISTDTDILSFAINEKAALVDALNHSIQLNLPAGTNLSALSPTLVISEGATVIPESVVAQNFTNPVIYTVTAEDGSTTQEWTVTVTEQSASPTDITLNDAVLPENQEPGFVIGQLTTNDPSFDDIHIYDIVSVDGQTSSTLFIIESNILKSNALFDFESGESYALLIKTTDQNGGEFEKILTINIENDGDEDGFTISTGDCDDEDANEYPNQFWYADTDGDGYGDPDKSLSQCEQPVNYVLNADDCDDTDAEVSPEMTWYADTDGDGFGDANSILIQCEQPTNYVLDNTDCDDSDTNEYPNQIWYADADGDGFGDPNTALSQCLQPSNYVLNNTDCDDTNANKNLIRTWFADSDGDGYGNPALSLTQCTPPANYVLNADDCDDTNSDISPERNWYADADGDGFGDSSKVRSQCEQPNGYVLDDTDCDDTDKDKNPNQTWYADTDGDGFGDENNTLTQCEQPTNYVLNADDCADTDADVSPKTTWYADTDGDGYGDPDNSLSQCEQPANFISDNTDCDDSDANINPNLTWYADEDGDGFGDANTSLTQCEQPVNFVLDNTDCDDKDANASPVTIWYADVDGDGFGDANTMVTQCTQPDNYVLNADDCDDTDPTASPTTIWYEDVDGDGFGDENNTLIQCAQPANYVLDSTDCDDKDADANPNQTWFADIDGDGFGDERSMLTQCTPPANYVLNAADCDDMDANISPETIWYEDADGDGFGDENTFLTQCEQPEGYTLNFGLIPLGNIPTNEEAIKVYCADNVLFIKLPTSNRVRQYLNLYSLSGKMVLETSTSSSTSLNLDGITPGIYLVKQTGSTLSHRIFIQ